MELLLRPRFGLRECPLHTKRPRLTYLYVMKDIGFVVRSYRKEVLGTWVLLHPVLKAATDCGPGAARPTTEHISQRVLLFGLQCRALSLGFEKSFLRCFLFQIIEAWEWSFFGEARFIIELFHSDFLLGPTVDHLTKFLHLCVEKSIVKLSLFLPLLFEIP